MGPSPSRPNDTQSLPERWKRGRRLAALGSLAVVALLATALLGHSGADELGSWWTRACFSLREKISNHLGQSGRDSQLVLVDIDEKCLDHWKEPLIAWGGHIAAGVNQLNRSGARLIALDWTQNENTSEFLKKDYDQELATAFSQAKAIVMVKFIRPDGKYRLPSFYLLNSLPGSEVDGGAGSLGYADLPSKNGINTCFYPSIPAVNPKDPVDDSFALRVAERSGAKVNEKAGLRSDGTMLINFPSNVGKTGPLAPFEHISLFDLEQAKQPDPRWKDKVFVLGGRFKGSNDDHDIPFLNGLVGSRTVPGMEVQASAIKTLVDGNAIREPEGASVWLLSVLLGVVGIGALTQLSWGRAAKLLISVVLGWALLSFGAFYLANYSLPVVLPFLCFGLGSVLMGGYRGLAEERQRTQVMKIMGSYQDPRLIDQILAHPEWQVGQGEEVVVTVLFADLKNFTKTVEHLKPQPALEALNRYLSLLSTVILDHGGIVDKFLGDGLMAQWGTPIPREDHATAAVNACLEINKRIAQLTAEMKAQGEVSFETRLTLHTGPVVAGPLGSDSRRELTIIGDTVNVTSRLQETAKALDSDFLISETTCAAMNGAVRTGRETEVEIRGRDTPLRVFEVLEGHLEVPIDTSAQVPEISSNIQRAKTSQNTDIL